jgi:CelD/BcsL family acetyltransferase involved in cellulose biosynthesis
MESDSTLRVSLIRPGELGPAEIAAWRRMQRSTPSLDNPFLTPEFAMAVGSFRPGARIGVLTEGPASTGFFPFERRRLGAGVPVCGWLTPCQGLIHEPGIEWKPREIIRACGLSSWQFDSLIVDQQPFRPYHMGTMPAPMIDLSDGFEAYYEKLQVRSPRFCRELGRKTRKIGREIGDLRIVADSRDVSVLHTLMAWKSAQYRQTSHVDRFSQPWLVGLLETLLATRDEGISGLLSALYAGDELVAAQFSLRNGSLLVGWFTAYDPRFRKYGPGLIHLKQLAEELAAAGIRVIDMGAGAKNSYKETMKSGDGYYAHGIVTSQSVLGAAHHARSALTWTARRTVRQHPGLQRAAHQILRHTGIATQVWGRI